MTLNDEERSQLRTRIRMEGTIDETVFDDLNEVLKLEIEEVGKRIVL